MVRCRWFPTADANGYARYEFAAFRNGRRQALNNLAVKILPVTSTAFGRQTVYVNHNWQVRAFLDAIDRPNTTIRLADDLNLDLSGRAHLNIKPGVHIIGGRSSTKLGPRLFTTSNPAVLFEIGRIGDADGVRITGIRLDGGNPGIADPDALGPIGISIKSSVNVEIGNNEIYGWAGVGVQVLDDRDRINLTNATAVWVHDNYVHHNRHWRREGYGVQANSGAYALIERNVFDYNRHAIEASNTDGIGYLAYHNLLFAGGGENCCLGEALQHTHQFDVHGTDHGLTCGVTIANFYCGQAGEYFDYRYNTLFYVNGNPIKVRGYPDIGADVTQNVFTEGNHGRAIVQTDGDNLHAWNNKFGAIESYRVGACDFDGDGQLDDFMATGATWWFKGVTGQWQFLNVSDRRFEHSHEFAFGDVNSDGRCDVTVNAEQVTYSGGRSKRLVNGAESSSGHAAMVWKPVNGSVRTWVLDPWLSSVAAELVVAVGTDTTVLATGDFNADGAADLLLRNEQEQVSVLLLTHSGEVINPLAGRPSVKGTMADAEVAGIGDFNADGRSDVLWLNEAGQLAIWFAGEGGNSTPATWWNLTDHNGAPIAEPNPDLLWRVEGVGDFDFDGYSDILWKHRDGWTSIWTMQHGMHIGEVYPGPVAAGWEAQGIGDFDADGYADILWGDAGGPRSIWFRGSPDHAQAAPNWQDIPGQVTGPEWQVNTVADVNGDGHADILWRNAGTLVIWKMREGLYIGESAPLAADASWSFHGVLQQGFQRIDLQ